VAFTVKAQQGGATATSMSLVLKVVTGAAPVQPGTTANANAISESVTPLDTGSWIYGAILAGATGSLTALSGNTFSQAATGGGLHTAQLRTTSTVTGGTPITVGSSTGTAISVVAAEIIAQGTLAEDASAPAVSGFVIATSITTASFSPPAGSLLVLMVSSNGAAGTTTMAVTDTSALGLTWVEQAKRNGASNGYTGVWTAQMPSPPRAPQPIPPGFISPASVFFTWRPQVPSTAHSGSFTGPAGVAGASRGVHSGGPQLINYAELPGPAVKPLSFASPDFTVPLTAPAAAAGGVTGVASRGDPFTGRTGVSGVMAGQKTANSSFSGPAATAGAANGINVGAGGMRGPSAISGSFASSRVADGAFTGPAAASGQITGNPPAAGAFAGAVAAAGRITGAAPVSPPAPPAGLLAVAISQANPVTVSVSSPPQQYSPAVTLYPPGTVKLP
jgi:hypothetical protein